MVIKPIFAEIFKMALDRPGTICIAFTDVTGVRIPVGTPLAVRRSSVRLCKSRKFHGFENSGRFYDLNFTSSVSLIDGRLVVLRGRSSDPETGIAMAY